MKLFDSFLPLFQGCQSPSVYVGDPLCFGFVGKALFSVVQAYAMVPNKCG
jgi:CRISPR/Cas system endoribonuclease Cas6 (RAMP superfamily)